MALKAKSKKKNILKFIFFFYLLVLVRIVIFKYPLGNYVEIVRQWSPDVFWQGLYHSNFTLFKTIRMYITYWGRINSFENLVGNIVIFIPFGLLYPITFEKGKNFFRLCLMSLAVILGLELVQMWTNFGAFDVDDILLNFVGTLLGYFLYLLSVKVFSKKA